MENLYCTIFIIDVSQNPEEVETVSSRIQQLIEDHGGIIKKVNPWGKRRLAYPIRKRNYGFYVEIEFTASSRLNIPRIIESEFRIDDRVFRYLTYVVTKKELTQREISAGKMPKEEEAPKVKKMAAKEPLDETSFDKKEKWFEDKDASSKEKDEKVTEKSEETEEEEKQ
jgi:small subunit ribosomal protein S6